VTATVADAGAGEVMAYPAAQGPGRPVHWATWRIVSPVARRLAPVCGAPIGTVRPLVYVPPVEAAGRTWCTGCLSWQQSLRPELS
jgi:hypothetical protein